MPSGGTGMLSAPGLSRSVLLELENLKLLVLPSGAGKLRSPLPPPPNDPVSAARMASAYHISECFGSKDNPRDSNDPLSEFSNLEKSLPSMSDPGSTKTSEAG